MLAFLSPLMILVPTIGGPNARPILEKPMNLPQQFATRAQEWAEHCRKTSTSSNLADYRNHPSFRRLVELGAPAVPLIMRNYASDELCPWELVLGEITGVQFITNPNEIVWAEVTAQRLAWWEKEKSKRK